MDDKLDLDELERLLAWPRIKEANDSLVLYLHKGLVVVLLSAARERDRLRQIISECAAANGALVAPSCTIEFMEQLPEDIRLRREREAAERDALRARVEELKTALRPFAACVFNDNFDMTITTSDATRDDFVRAYFAMRRAARKEQSDD